jgi:hypothetical protein
MRHSDGQYMCLTSDSWRIWPVVLRIIDIQGKIRFLEHGWLARAKLHFGLMRKT